MPVEKGDQSSLLRRMSLTSIGRSLSAPGQTDGLALIQIPRDH
jgi:hypothetical protein